MRSPGTRLSHPRRRFEWLTGPRPPARLGRGGFGLQPPEAPMRAERFDFPNARGETLAALLQRPAGEPVAFALFAHCFTCGKDNLAAKRIAETLAERGIAVL